MHENINYSFRLTSKIFSCTCTPKEDEYLHSTYAQPYVLFHPESANHTAGKYVQLCNTTTEKFGDSDSTGTEERKDCVSYDIRVGVIR